MITEAATLQNLEPPRQLTSGEIAMKLVYGKEKPLFALVLILSLLIWALVAIGVASTALVALGPAKGAAAIGAGLLVIYIILIFAHSGYISHLRGNGAKISKDQYPDLYEQVENACKKLGMAKVPDAYLLNSNGVLNALATRFLWRNYLVLYADIVNALDERPGAVSFYIGHEIGHIKRGHLLWGPVLTPGKCFPLLGFGYRRAQEYTCDLHGLACCAGLEDAQRALVVLAAGKRRWKSMNLGAYTEQVKMTGGFWMSFHEFTSDYPWLVKRVEQVTAVSQNRDYQRPRRSFFAGLLALLVFRFGLSGAWGGLFTIYIVGIMAAIAIPAYQDYIARSQTVEAVELLNAAQTGLVQYYADHNALPTDLGQAYQPAAAGSNVGRYTDSLALAPAPGSTVGIVATMKQSGVAASLAGKTVELWTEDEGKTWKCGPGSANPVDVKYLPASCRTEGAP